jgi:hypothetical protein
MPARARLLVGLGRGAQIWGQRLCAPRGDASAESIGGGTGKREEILEDERMRGDERIWRMKDGRW